MTDREERLLAAAFWGERCTMHLEAGNINTAISTAISAAHCANLVLDLSCRVCGEDHNDCACDPLADYAAPSKES